MSVVGTRRSHTCSDAEVQQQHALCAVADARNSAVANLLVTSAAPDTNGAAAASAADK